MLSKQVPKAILITTEDTTAKKKRAKEAKNVQKQLDKRMKELQVFRDKTILMQATNKAKKSKGKKRKEKETVNETSSTKKKPDKNLAETLLTCDELDELTDIEWPEEYQEKDEETEVEYDLIGHRINKDGKPQFFLNFTWEDDKNSSGWHSAFDAYQDYPHETATFMMQMKLNEKKAWEPLWKKLDTKLRKNCPRQLYVKETDVKCNYDHDMIATNFEAETNPAHWGPNGDTCGKKCSRCNKDIVKQCEPTVNKPVHCCKGRTKFFCEICFCSPCYLHMILEDGKQERTGKRKRKRTSSS